MLDEAGWTDCKISVSNSLDEYIIRDLLRQGAQIDMFGVGERLITAKSEPVFGGVYKLAAIEEPDGTVVPKIKISENVEKITNPHHKKLYRFYAKDTGKAIADYLTVYDEVVDDSKDMTIFDPDATWKTKKVYNFTARELQVPVFKSGELVYKLPSLEEIRAYCLAQVDTLWDEVKRFDNPQTYYVDLSQKLWDIKYRPAEIQWQVNERLPHLWRWAACLRRWQWSSCVWGRSSPWRPMCALCSARCFCKRC